MTLGTNVTVEILRFGMGGLSRNLSKR